MQKSPKFSHWVLNRCAGQQKSIARIELKKNLPTAGKIVLDGLSLVEDHVVPFYLQQPSLVLRIVYDQIVTGNKHVNLHRRICQVLRVQEFCQLFALILTTPIRQHLQAGAVFLELVLPVVKRHNRYYDKERTPSAFSLSDMSHERNCLNRFTQAHFVSKDAINALLVQIVEPAKTSELIMLKSCSKDSRLLNRLCLLFQVKSIDI